MTRFLVLWCLMVTAVIAQVVEARFSPGGGCTSEMVRAIDSATSTVDLAIYSLNHPAITGSILAAARRGVRVRMVADKTQAAGRSSKTGDVERAKIPIHIQRGTGGGIQHLKMAIIDRKVALAGSFSWTVPGESKNDEILLTIRDKPTVVRCAGKFEQLWRSQP
jgi:phosphatidylserine/phosphatidylglycerophosphate/cardiolipin synthase-like enzyme